MAQKLATDVAAGILAAGVSFAGPAVLSANAITSEVRNQLSYEQVKGTGLANRCARRVERTRARGRSKARSDPDPFLPGRPRAARPRRPRRPVVARDRARTTRSPAAPPRCNEVVGKDSISVPGSGYSLVDVCLEPKTWQVEEQVANKKGDVSKQFVNTKLMTRQTYTLDGISGKLSGGSGITFTEEDGIDYAPTTVQLPGGERVPFLFTVKELVAKGNGGAFKPGYEFGGTFKVPSYRTGLFLDPKGRGMTTGYDQAQALAASQTGTDSQGELEGEINKVFDVFDGTIEFAVSQVNAAEGEIGGVFVSSQASDTDLGSKTPKKVLSKGIFYGRVVKD